MMVLGSALRFTDAEAGLAVLETRITTLKRFWPHAGGAILATLNNLANICEDLGELAKALRIRRQVYEMHLTHEGRSGALLAANNLSGALLRNHLFAEALEFARAQHEFVKRALGDRDELRLTATARLADALFYSNPSIDSMTEAEALYIESITMARRLFGESHPDTCLYARQLGNLRQALAQLRANPQKTKVIFSRTYHAH